MFQFCLRHPVANLKLSCHEGCIRGLDEKLAIADKAVIRPSDAKLAGGNVLS